MESRPGGSGRDPWEYLEEEQARERKQLEQRPWGRIEPGATREQPKMTARLQQREREREERHTTRGYQG